MKKMILIPGVPPQAVDMTAAEIAAENARTAAAAERFDAEEGKKALSDRWPDPFALLDDILDAIDRGGVDAVKELKAERDAIKSRSLDKKRD